MCQNFTSSHKIRFKEFRKKVFKTIDQMTQTNLTRRKYLRILQKMISRKKNKTKKTAQVYFQFLREKVSLIHTKKCRKLKKNKKNA